ncbi:SDR family oxidoreductase [Micromonospora sp. NPDC047548]|uniref:SDR family oxidoreductase n=1 Tax=Micromonospora sp. NPDC047548 TaxID=3155624 RepID=UPI003410C7BA
MTTQTEIIDSSLDLAGKVVLVTGATRGLGLAIARKLCASGCEVLLNYANDDNAAEEAVRALTGLGGKIDVVKADIGRPDEIDRLLDEITRTHGRLDVLVHNASLFHPMPSGKPSAGLCEEDRAVALGPLLHGVERLAAMLPDGSGRIIAISSSGARQVVPGYVSLGMAKAALESLVRYLAVEFAPRGITVNTISAGKLDKGTGSDPGGMATRIVARTPGGRLTGVDDVADVAALLCRKEAGWIHGQVIVVDGGLGLTA